MTTYGPFFNPVMLVIGALGLVLLAAIAGVWKGEKPEGYWMISALEVGGMLVLWGTLSFFVRFLGYSGGTIEFITLGEILADIGGYMTAAGTLVIIEMYRDRERRFENYRLERMQEISADDRS
ncbi:MAG: hypothetical protein RTV72_11650 [Candidatus Thorarchaeota archaeon]